MRRASPPALVAFALAQAACVWLCLSVLGHGLAAESGPLLGLPAVVLLLHAWGAAAVPLALTRRTLSPARRTLLHEGAALAAIALTLVLAALWSAALLARYGPGSLILGAVLLGLLWWRSALLAADSFVHGALLAEWRTYAIVVVVMLLVGAPTSGLGGGTGLAVTLFLGGGLVALAAAWRRGLMPTAQAGPRRVDSAWATTLGLAVTAILVAALLGAALLGPSFTRGLLNALGSLLNGVLWVLTPLLLLMGWIVAFLIELARAVRHGSARPPPPQVPRQVPASLPHALHVLHNPAWLSAAGIALLVAGLLLLLVWATRRAMSRRAPAAMPPAGTLEEQREALMSWRQLWAVLAAWLRRAGRRRSAIAGVGPSSPAAAEAPLAPSTLTIREIYRRLLALGAARGTARTATETPYEYLARLRGGIAEREKEISLITSAYVQARYSAAPATSRQVEQARTAWERLAVTTTAPRRQDGGDEPEA